MKGQLKLRQFSACICDEFEDLLDAQDISIPDEDRSGDECEARLFGSTYAELEDSVTSILCSLVEAVKAQLDIQVDSLYY